MKINAIASMIIVSVILSLVLGVPLWAAEMKKQTAPVAEAVKAQPQQQKQSTDPIKKIEPLSKPTPPKPDAPGPIINKFTCKSLTKGYNEILFDGPAFDPNNRLSVDYDISASQGLQKLEITLGGNRVYEENFVFGRPAVTSTNRRDLRLDVTAVPIARSGFYQLQLTVWDLRGRVINKEIRLRCDLERPKINSIRPANGETVYLDGGSVDITFEFNVSDDFSGISAVWMGGFYGSFTDTTSPFSITIRNIERDASFDIQVVDGEGNVKSDYITVHVVPRRASMPATRP